MGPKKKDPSEGKGGKKGGKEDKESKAGGGSKGNKEKEKVEEELSDVEEELPSEEALALPPPVVTPEFSYNKNLTLEQVQQIFTISANLEDAARYLAAILGLKDCIFNARNMILLEYCLGNLMFAKNAGLNIKQALEIYEVGHMVLDLIRAGNPFADAERLFKNRMLSSSIIRYEWVAPKPIVKEENKPKEGEKLNDYEKSNEIGSQKPKDTAKQKETKKSKGSEKTKEGKKSKEGKKPNEANKVKEEDTKPKEDDKQPEAATQVFEKPLFSPYDLQKITPYFISTVFQHYCLYQYCFTKEHYNIRRHERVLVETAMTHPLSEAKFEWEVEEEEAARIAAIEKARQDEHAAKVRAKQEYFDALEAEAKKRAEEELTRKALTLDEYIELAVRHKIEEAKKAIIEEYDYREYFLIDKILQRKKEQEDATKALATKDATIVDKIAPPAKIEPPPTIVEKKKKKGK